MFSLRNSRLGRAALALLFPLTACATQTAPRPAGETAARPAMWKVADKDTTIYLFGTIHLLPEGRGWRTPAMDAALAHADELVLEVADVDDMMATAQAMAKLGMSSRLPPIAERVPEDKKAALRAMIAETGYPEAAIDRLETWAAALSLLGVSFKRLGLDPNLGVERQIGAPFKATGKKVIGLETVEEQFGIFDALSEEAQRAFLLGVLDESADAKAQFRAMLDAWAAGDLDGIARTFNDTEQLSPQLRDVLLSKRNARWAEWLDRRMDRPGTVFVAVGAGHLAGDESVQKMLRARGLKAKRVQ